LKPNTRMRITVILAGLLSLLCTLNPVRGLTRQPSLMAAKFVDVDSAVPGETRRYTLVIMNDMLGDQDPGARASLTDTLPPGVEFIYGSLGSDGTYDADSRTVEWEGAVPRGGSVAISFGVLVTGEETGTIINRVRVLDAFGHEVFASVGIMVTAAPTATQPPLATPTTTLAAPAESGQRLFLPIAHR